MAQHSNDDRALAQVLSVLAEFRAIAAQAKDRYLAKKAQLDTQLDDLRAEAAWWKERESRQEEYARSLALALHNQTGKKKLPWGVSIADTKHLRYTAEDAVSWAVEHQAYALLKLNTTEWEKMVRNTPELAARELGISDIVVITTEKQPRLPTKIDIPDDYQAEGTEIINTEEPSGE